jgi:hypothetical protein
MLPSAYARLSHRAIRPLGEQSDYVPGQRDMSPW